MSTNRMNYLLRQQIRRLFAFRNVNNQIKLNQQRCQAWYFRWVRRYKAPFIAIPAFSLTSWTGWGQKKEEPSNKEAHASGQSKLIITEEADKLYLENRIEELYDYLIQNKSADDEILWRLARATVDMGKLSDNNNTKKERYYEAFEYIKEALQINDKNFAVHKIVKMLKLLLKYSSVFDAPHIFKWYAILLDYTGEFEGYKKRIQNAADVKKHFEKAVELNPKDATSIHSLGFWCYVFADLKWYQRRFVSTFYASPPTASFEEALKYFLQAEETEPNFYSMNLLMLGKTYMRLQDAQNAYLYFVRCRERPVITPDDKQAHKEAESFINILLKAGKGKGKA